MRVRLYVTAQRKQNVTHTKMRNLMMNISWVYKGNTAKMTRLVKALTDTLSRMA